MLRIKKSNWKKSAQYRLENKWLEYATRIALRVKVALDDKQISQTQFAEKIGVKEQWLSRVIKGQSNLTLKSIHKLSEGLEVELITFPDFKYTEAFLDSSSNDSASSFKKKLTEAICEKEEYAEIKNYVEILNTKQDAKYADLF